ncbi:alpha-galactosidase, partial [Paenibacillus riograndensis]
MDSKRIEIAENGLYLTIEITGEQDVRLLHFGAAPLQDGSIAEKNKPGFRLLELQLSGEDRDEYHGRTHRASYPGLRMEYGGHSDSVNALGRKLEITLTDPVTGITAVQHLQFYTGVQTVRCWTVLKNTGTGEAAVEYVSTFALTGVDKEGSGDRNDKMEVTIAHSGWKRELQWRTYRLPELGRSHMADRGPKRIHAGHTGSGAAAEARRRAARANSAGGAGRVGT